MLKTCKTCNSKRELKHISAKQNDLVLCSYFCDVINSTHSCDYYTELSSGDFSVSSLNLSIQRKKQQYKEAKNLLRGKRRTPLIDLSTQYTLF